VSEHNSSWRRLMDRGWQYGGLQGGVEWWQSPDGRGMWLDQALAEIEGQPTNEEKKTMPTPEGGIIPNFDGGDPLDADVIEDLVVQEYPDDRLKRLLFRHCIFYVKMEHDGRTLRDVWNWFDRVGELPLGEQRKALNPIREAAGFPSFEAVEAKRELEMAASMPTPTRISGNGSGFTSEPVRHEDRLRGISATFGEIPSSSEVERAERRERELAEGDEQRNEARRREAEREREAATSTGWFGQ
jgi:hypothetical protein